MIFFSSSLFFRSSSSCFLFNSISAFLKYSEKKFFFRQMKNVKFHTVYIATPLTYSLLSSSSCLRRCSSFSLLFLSFSISSWIFFSRSLSSSSCFFFCIEKSNCSERFTRPWYSVSISFQVIFTVAWWGGHGNHEGKT